MDTKPARIDAMTQGEWPTVARMIHEEFVRLKMRNSKFSLRAFARFLKLSPSHLSEVLAGKKRISARNARVFLEKLKLQDDRRKLFSLLVEYENSNAESRTLLQRRIRMILTRMRTRRLEPGNALPRLRWEHQLLLVAFDLQPALRDEELAPLSRFLGAGRAEFRSLIEDLIAAGLAEKRNGRYVRIPNEIIFESNQTNLILKEVHRSYLERIRKFLGTRSFESRYSTTEFYSIPSRKAPIVRARTEEFLDELSELAAGEEADTLLELALHLNFTSRDELVTGD